MSAATNRNVTSAIRTFYTGKSRKAKLCVTALLTAGFLGFGAVPALGWGWSIEEYLWGKEVIDIDALAKNKIIDENAAKQIQIQLERLQYYAKRIQKIVGWRNADTGLTQLSDDLGKVATISNDMSEYLKKYEKISSIDPKEKEIQAAAVAQAKIENNQEYLKEAAQRSQNAKKIAELRQKISEMKEEGELSAIQKASYLDAISVLEKMELLNANAQDTLKESKDAIVNYLADLQRDASMTAFWTVKAYDPFHPENFSSSYDPNKPDELQHKSEDLGFVKFKSNFSD